MTITSTEKTGARTSEAAGVITGARERIDALDDRIIGLIQERVAVSAVIQEARIESGGRRVNLSREMEILAHYSDALGKPGTALAMTLLELRIAFPAVLRRFPGLRLAVPREELTYRGYNMVHGALSIPVAW